MIVKIYHNPRCTKSRQTLALLTERGLSPDVIEYLKTPPCREDILDLLKKLNMAPRDIMRKQETPYKDLNLADSKNTDDQLIQAISDNPILMERPIVVTETKAAIGRPPENVLDIL